MQPGAAISEAIRRRSTEGSPALIAFLTAGFPDRDAFARQLLEIASVADIVEIGVPFSDPMADGATIQRSSRIALERGVTLAWILDQLKRIAERPTTPLLLMSYFNPLLAFGLHRLSRAARDAGISGFIVPDLPWEECGELRETLGREGIALVQMVTPVTPAARLETLARASQGFVYAVTVTGTTGREVGLPDGLPAYLDRVRSATTVPVCAGFGIRSPDQVTLLARHADGVIVGSALMERIERNADCVPWLQELRNAGVRRLS